ncbi:MAG TPA: isocitrate lyase/phosphoenolpyruvate mutase family protein [Gaiellaceae bacterium]|nr:isocitrate lyase/phosphoenolpyruvate mutase family protein [Gaiellaceae bacterium]
MSAAERRARFRELHDREGLFLLPNPWDVGSARLLEELGFEALATTSQGFAWALGKLDYGPTRDEVVAHVEALAAAVTVPLNVDSANCFPGEPGGVAETVRLLGEAGAAGCSIEDYDPDSGLVAVELAAERVAAAAEAAHRLDPPMILTGRAENHIRGVDELDDTISRLHAYREAGADCLYAPGLTDLGRIRRVVDEAGAPVNVLALPAGPGIRELEAAGVRRASTGSLLAGAAYGALAAAARELLEQGTSEYAKAAVSRDLVGRAFD